MADLADPQPDNRPPGYGCHLSFGMKGPSRMLLQMPDPPDWAAELVDGVLVPHLETTLGDPIYQAMWSGDTAHVLYLVVMGINNPEFDLWVVDVLLNQADGPGVMGFRNFYPKFTWSHGWYNIIGLSGDQRPIRLRCPREWMNIRSIYPDITIAELP